jgi:hypothetical protein
MNDTVTHRLEIPVLELWFFVYEFNVEYNSTMRRGNSEESLSEFGVSHRNSIQNIVGTLKTRVNRQEPEVFNIAIESTVGP